ncbi:GNAT family N-acetyltransferase [Nonlabens ponticola]|uniref:GNAT family N-acetyltransferase n=1 Tax=Nonlabens ponticola TaxID=2496866 RepID=A0A3S9MXT3_9FLAO|nr:GNAT family N-acetyltransferase [Nonlabens ponticola]AZQ43942.1 GNAT family N-acetyltransferase [Nonlabens ponticola]
MQEATLKLAHTSEFQKALSILKTAAQHLLDKGIDQWSYWLDPPAERLEWLQEGFELNEIHFIQFQKETAGMIRIMHKDLKYWGHQEQSALYIHSLVILPAFTGKKIGAHVIEQVKNKAVTQDIYLLRLDCDSSNERLCAYYENLGFKKVYQRQMMYSINNFYELSIV